MAEAKSDSGVDGEVDTKGAFTSLQVLLESLALFDLQVITTNPLRIWKHDPSKKQDAWKPDTTQYSCGAQVQISDVKRVTGISGKGWNETSEYWLGKTDKNKWVRLINFRGMATAIPHMKNFRARVGGVVNKVNEVQNMLSEEVDRRKTAELRLRSAEKRMAEVDAAKTLAETRVQEIEERLREIERIQAEKEELNAKTIKIAKNEATEAKVLMKYFENRMKDSEANYKTCDANYKEAQEALKRMEAQLAASDSSVTQLKKALETSECQRMKLIQDAEKSAVEGAPEAGSSR